MKPKTTVLYVEGCRDGTVGGSHTCLQRLIAHLDRQRFRPVVIFYDEHVVARGLRDLGVEVHVLPNIFPADLVAAVRRGRLSPLAGLVRPIQQAWNFLWHFVKPVVRHAVFIRRVRADIVHLNNSVNTNHDWMVAAKIAGVQVVSHERGISDRLSRTSRLLAERLDALVCVSRAVLEPLMAQGISPAKACVIYDGMESTQAASPQRAVDVRAALSIPHDAAIIGVLGNVKHWKGQETVVRALAILRDQGANVRCLFVGSQPDPGYKQRLDQLVAELNLREQVIFTGFQDSPGDYLRVMDVVIHSSITPEPFGMVNLEAMCLGKPVVATAIGGPMEIVEHAKTGFLVPPGDPERLAQHVAQLLTDPGLRQRIGSAAKVAVAQRFRMAETVSQTVAVYRKLGVAV